MKSPANVAISAIIFLLTSMTYTIESLAKDSKSGQYGVFHPILVEDRIRDRRDIVIETDAIGSRKGHFGIRCFPESGKNVPHLYVQFGKKFLGHNGNVAATLRIDSGKPSTYSQWNLLVPGHDAAVAPLEFIESRSYDLSSSPIYYNNVVQAMKEGKKILVEVEDTFDGETRVLEFRLAGFDRAFEIVRCG